MDPILVIIIFVTIFVLVFVSSGIKIIQQAETMVIERLGKYNKTLDSGINIIIPIFDKPSFPVKNKVINLFHILEIIQLN